MARRKTIVEDQTVEVLAEIARCPFCGSYDDHQPEVHLLSESLYHVVCGNMACHVYGPGRCSPDAAVRAWNKRAPI